MLAPFASVNGWPPPVDARREREGAAATDRSLTLKKRLGVMTQSPSPAFQSALAALSTALKTINRPAMLVGGPTVVARGVPRITIDIGAVVQAEGLDLDRLWEVLRASGFEPRISEAAEFDQLVSNALTHD